MPKEYIEREEVREAFYMEFDEDYADDIVDRLPTADVQEVRHSKWEYEDSDIGWTDYKCSDCGNIISTVVQEEDLYSYCPNCGAKMDKR